MFNKFKARYNTTHSDLDPNQTCKHRDLKIQNITPLLQHYMDRVLQAFPTIFIYSLCLTEKLQIIQEKPKPL